jgi:hypothetical protein
MIDDLDETLAALLRRELSAGLAHRIQVSFEAPDNPSPPQSIISPALALLRYDARKNSEVRSNDVYLDRPRDGPAPDVLARAARCVIADYGVAARRAGNGRQAGSCDQPCRHAVRRSRHS